MATDEAVMRRRIEDLVPDTLRLYRWKPSAVSIGKFQNPENEVQLENCKRMGVDVVRRITGGGAVYHDEDNELTYSVVADKANLRVQEVTAVYRKIYSGLTEALRIIGLTTDFSEGTERACPNLTVNSKKISGSAQSHRGRVVLQHGTLLMRVDLKRMFSMLSVPSVKTGADMETVAETRITSVEAETHRNVSFKEIHQALVEGFQNALNIELVTGELTTCEQELAKELYKEKYVTPNWNFHGVSRIS